MKSFLRVVIFVCVILLFAVTLCAASSPINVVHVALGNYGDHWVQLVSGGKSMASQLGIELTVLDAQMSAAKQVQMLENAISMKPDAIFIDHGEGASMKPAIQKAMGLGIPVILFDVITDVEVTSEISQDDYMLGYMSLSKLAMDLNGTGNFVIVTLSGVAPLERRMRILDLVLKRFPGLKVVQQTAPSFGSAVISDTMSRMEAILKAPGKIDAVWAPYDQLSIGSMKAIEEAGKDIPVYGVDVSSYDLTLMAKPGSVWKATAACDPSEVGKVAIRMAYLATTGKKELIPRQAIIPAALITQEVARSLDLVAGEYITKELVPAWGDSGIAWTPEMRKLVQENVNK